MTKRKPGDTAPAVDFRGRITIPLDGADYLLRPSYDAVIAIEQELGRSTLQLAQQAVSGTLTTTDMAVICCELMKAQGKADPTAGPSYLGAKVERIGQLIMEASAPKIMARLAVLLMGVVTGGYTAQGELKPAT